MAQRQLGDTPTRGLLLDFTEPTAYTGTGMELVRDKWNSWSTSRTTKTTKTAAVCWTTA